jgi:hypothetical protein
VSHDLLNVAQSRALEYSLWRRDPMLKLRCVSSDGPIMPAGLFDILLVLVGAACMAGGFFIGSWHRRAADRAEVDAADFASDERMTRMIRSLIHDDVIDDERPN